jgi:hypothetical protein
VGYDNLGLAIDYEFPELNDSSKASNQKGKKAQKAQVVIPTPIKYQLPSKTEDLLKACDRKVNIYSRINIKIKPTDINNYLHHLVNIRFIDEINR